MKNSTLTVLFALLFSPLLSAQNCRDSNIPNQLLPGFISNVQTNFENESIGQIYDFDLKPFSKIAGQPMMLKFNLAYTYLPEYFDSLHIMVSSDSGKNWETLLYSGGKALSTTAPIAEYFIPNRSDWQTYLFDLDRCSGTLLIRFRFINGHGNNLYIDDLSVQDGLSVAVPLIDIKSNLSPNPIHESALIQLDQSVQNAILVIMDSLGREVQRIQNVQGEQILLDAKNLNPGLYYYLLMLHGQTKSYGQFAIVD